MTTHDQVTGSWRCFNLLNLYLLVSPLAILSKKKKEWWLFFVLVAVLAALFDFLTSWHTFFFDNDSHPLLKDGLQRLFCQTVQSINDCYTWQQF
jgi:peptidoglycan/LPS O-acetylase OafA/YrhL